MSSNKALIRLELALSAVKNWNDNYQWIPICALVATTALAFLAGANNLPAPLSSPVGSRSLTFLKTSMIACMIYVPGAAFIGKNSADKFFALFIKENQASEDFIMSSILIALITATIWLALATYLELPVSPQQSTQAALLGTVLITDGFRHIPLWNKNQNHEFNGGGVLWILVEWTIAPVMACVCAYLLFSLLKYGLLRREKAEKRILVFLPIDYGISAGLLSLFLIYQVREKFIHITGLVAIISVAVAGLAVALITLIVVVPLRFKKTGTAKVHKIERQNAFVKQADEDVEVEDVLKDFMQMRVLETVYEEDEWSKASSLEVVKVDIEHNHSVSYSTGTRELLDSTTPDKKIIQQASIANYIGEFFTSILLPILEFDKGTLNRHAMAEKYDDIEDFFRFPLLLASCIFAFIQSSTEVAAMLTPYEAINDIFTHRAKYSANKQHLDQSINSVWWYRAIAGLVAVMGFFLYGMRLTRCLGGKVTYMSNSRGLASQLATVAAIVTVTRMNIPVSCVHVFVGSLVGVGIADDFRNVNWKLVMKLICGWVMTIVFCCGVSYGIFLASIHSPAYVVVPLSP